jgi:hypothetical protein
MSMALMLGYTIFVLIRFFRRYQVARHELRGLEAHASPDTCRNGRKLLADLSRGLGTLRGIAYAAPFLALAGTSYGILAAPSWFHYRGVSGLYRDFAATLINTAFGILVAVPATLSHNLLRAPIETLSGRLLTRRNWHGSNLGSFQFAQTLPLKKRLAGLPHFALIAVPVLAFLAMGYVVFKPYPMPTGLSVGVLPIGSLDRSDSSSHKLTISIFSKENELPVIRVNSKQVPWERLEDAVGEKLSGVANPHAYVEADAMAHWAYVAAVIDLLLRHYWRAVLLTTVPAGQVKHPPVRR